MFRRWVPWRYGGEHDNPDDDTRPFEVTMYYRRMYYHEYRFDVGFYEPSPDSDFVSMSSVSVPTPENPLQFDPWLILFVYSIPTRAKN